MTRQRAPTIHAAAARKRCGQRDRPSSHLDNWCGARQARNSRISPAARRLKSSEDRPSAAAVEGDAVKLHAMVDEAETKLFGNPLLEVLEFFVDELDDRPGLDVDQLVMLSIRRGLVARASVSEPWRSECRLLNSRTVR